MGIDFDGHANVLRPAAPIAITPCLLGAFKGAPIGNGRGTDCTSSDIDEHGNPRRELHDEKTPH